MLQHLAAVHLPERIGDQFDAGPVRVPKIERDAAVLGELHAGRGELVPQPLPARRLRADREVVQPAEDLLVRALIEAGKAEERQQVVIADVEEEMRRAGIVTVLDQFGQRKSSRSW